MKKRIGMKTAVVLALVAGCELLPGIASCQPGAWVPAYNAPMPQYWTGTNCRAFGEMYVYPVNPGWPYAAQFTSAFLTVNGSVVDHWTAGPETPFQHITLSAMFDSSHFEDESQTIVKIFGCDNYGRYYEAENYAYTWNKAHIFFSVASPPDQIENATAFVSQQLSGGKYDSSVFIGGWTGQSFQSYIKDSILHVTAHGVPNAHQDGLNQDVIYDEMPLPSMPDYIDARLNHTGAGWPPFNSTGTPPINLLILETCQSNIDDAMEEALFPYANFYSNYVYENQAIWGYSIYIAADESYERASVMLPYLLSGETVGMSKLMFLLDAEEVGIHATETNSQGQDPTWRIMLPNDIELSGDHFTRIKKVYTGDHSHPSGNWYREL